MSFFTALSLSLNNLMTKKGRTILTAFAGSIGIIGIALILSLSSGVQEYINRVQEETLTSYPLSIESASIDLSSAMTEVENNKEEKENREQERIYSNNTIGDTMQLMSSRVQTNNLDLFKKHIESSDSAIKDYTTAISYEYNLHLQLFKENTEDGIVQVNPNTVLDSIGMKPNEMQANFIVSDVWSKMFENEELNNQMYKLLAGKMPENYNEVVIVVDENNRISDFVLYALGLKDQNELKDMYDRITKGEEVESKETSYSFDDILNLKFKLLLNTDYYEKVNNIWVNKKEDEDYLKDKIQNAEEIKVVGILKPNDDATVTTSMMGGVLYNKELEEYVIDKINNSEIVKEQKESPDTNVLTGLEFSDEEFDISKLNDQQRMYLQTLPAEQLADLISQYKEQAEATYESVLQELGSVDLEKPTSIYLYAKDFESKETIKNLISDYNEKQKQDGNEGNVINYNDLVGMLMNSVTGIVDMISYVLIGFVSISLVVSSIMIGIITYISVLERTKEIGILRAIGASKKDVSRVFNAETLIVGLFAGVIGIGVTILLNIPINLIIQNVADVSNLSHLPVIGGAILVLISVVLTIIAGLIPAKIASKQDPVKSLRTE